LIDIVKHPLNTKGFMVKLLQRNHY
jgi:hypothetical protein